MAVQNYFEAVLAFIRRNVEETSDVTQAIRDSTFPILDGLVSHPFDAGIRRFRSFAISIQASKANDQGQATSSYLLVVRGVSEGGEDVISFTNGGCLEEVIAQYAHLATTGELEWKPDTRNSGGTRKTSFFESFVSREIQGIKERSNLANSDLRVQGGSDDNKGISKTG